MMSEFREFASRGSVVDLAIGVVIGAAFGAITKSLVDHILMPPVGLLLGGVDFSQIVTTLKAAGPDGKGAVVISWGLFFQAILNFLIIAWVMFLIVKGMNAMKRKQEAAPEPAGPSEEVKLLTEIRDSLRK
ncbi:MAG: large-conductance mechanosensitive channel protein MscL [Bradyrhizobiaceae bacterium]|nr:large-conductance mechanosensitive channel protein MscL [Bradyrhizobiaceae bacterium]